MNLRTVVFVFALLIAAPALFAADRTTAKDFFTEPPTLISLGFNGRGPDLGAYEVGKPVPQYGPRK